MEVVITYAELYLMKLYVRVELVTYYKLIDVPAKVSLSLSVCPPIPGMTWMPWYLIIYFIVYVSATYGIQLWYWIFFFYKKKYTVLPRIQE